MDISSERELILTNGAVSALTGFFIQSSFESDRLLSVHPPFRREQ